jgi:RNA polymerase sigma factor (sigma-70 family)
MINEQEAQDLMIKFIDLRKKAAESDDIQIKRELQAHQNLCMRKFAYLVTMRTNRYKGFSNYDDLNQEGFEALIKSMKNYDPKKGIFFWWAHKYIDTRISRSANLHTAIRYPLKFAKATPPHKESQIPIMIEPRFNPDKILESNQLRTAMFDAMQKLTSDQRNVISLAFGFDGDKPLSINKICKKLSISRLNCIKTINVAMELIKTNIKL